MKIKKDDNVIVISGKDKGKTGKVARAFPRENKIIVAGVNIKKINKRPQKSGQKGQIIEQAAPFHVSNVQILDPKDNKPTRIRLEISGDKKVRVAKRSGTTLS
jgi:large subunit ribosomal protein L24